MVTQRQRSKQQKSKDLGTQLANFRPLENDINTLLISSIGCIWWT